MKELLTFDDVLIAPKFSMIESRSSEFVNISTSLRGLDMAIPVISANMDTVTGTAMAQKMVKSGAQACLHRFGTIEETVEDWKNSKGADGLGPMVSIGISPYELERAKALLDAGAHTFVIDVAHGAQIGVVRQAKALRELLGPHVNLVVGNFATGESVRVFLEHSGNIVDAFKVGIGPGSACTTRIKTGVGVPQLSAILDVVNTLKNTGIVTIADGGMKTAGDVCKALAAGAKMVMLGGMLAGTDESPGETVYRTNTHRYLRKDEVFPKKILEDGSCVIDTSYRPEFPAFKKYRGSASLESYQVQGKVAKHRTPEGESFLVPYKGPVSDILWDIVGGLRSSMSYVGAGNLSRYPGQVEFVRVSTASVTENGAHGNGHK